MIYIKKYEDLLLEKRIHQFSSDVQVTLSFDIIKTQHADKRSGFSKRNLEADNQYHISNREMTEFVLFFKREITDGIINGDIKDQTEFVLKSLDRELAMSIVAEFVSHNYWKLIITTVFRESSEHRFRVGKDQVVYTK
jgi:hypothetical protein